jgi:hypothetical protein
LARATQAAAAARRCSAKAAVFPASSSPDAATPAAKRGNSCDPELPAVAPAAGWPPEVRGIGVVEGNIVAFNTSRLGWVVEDSPCGRREPNAVRRRRHWLRSGSTSRCRPLKRQGVRRAPRSRRMVQPPAPAGPHRKSREAGWPEHGQRQSPSRPRRRWPGGPLVSIGVGRHRSIGVWGHIHTDLSTAKFIVGYRTGWRPRKPTN